jgi:hypothetical protein
MLGALSSRKITPEQHCSLNPNHEPVIKRIVSNIAASWLSLLKIILSLTSRDKCACCWLGIMDYYHFFGEGVAQLLLQPLLQGQREELPAEVPLQLVLDEKPTPYIVPELVGEKVFRESGL